MCDRCRGCNAQSCVRVGEGYSEEFEVKVGVHQGSVLSPLLCIIVQSNVSLMSSLRVISLTVLADSIYNILIFFAEKNVSSFCTAKATHIFSAKNFSIFAYHSM